MTDHTDSDFVDVKKLRHVPGVGDVDVISIEGGLRAIHKAAWDVQEYLNIAGVIAKDVDGDLGEPAMLLMLMHANETISKVWSLTQDLGNSLGVDVNTKQEKNEEVTS